MSLEGWLCRGFTPYSIQIIFFYTEVDWLDIIGILYFIFLNDPGILFLEYANGLDILLAGYYWNSSYYIPLYDLLKYFTLNMTMDLIEYELWNLFL